jgi:hypothetical protein
MFGISSQSTIPNDPINIIPITNMSHFYIPFIYIPTNPTKKTYHPKKNYIPFIYSHYPNKSFKNQWTARWLIIEIEVSLCGILQSFIFGALPPAVNKQRTVVGMVYG